MILVRLKFKSQFQIGRSTQDEITGRCENVYDWAPAASEGNLTQMFCGVAAKHRYRVIKTRNFDNCTVLPMFNLVTPVALRCPLSSAICENVQSVITLKD